MINNNMDSDKKDEIQEDQLPTKTRPNESTGIYVRGFVRISDPESGEIILETTN